MSPLLSIIIVNYKTPELVIQCLESIYKETTTTDFEILVVDNCSKDNSKELVLAEFSKVRWVQNESNEGFGRANNIGIEKARGKMVLLLNSDIIVVDKAIDAAVARLQNDDDRVGLATCQLLNADGTQQRSIYFYNASYSEIWGYNLLVDYFRRKKNRTNNSREIQAVNGAFILFDKERLLEVGHFDKDFFMYAEEIDWCRRVIDKGLLLKQYKDVNVIHLEGRSGESDWSAKQRKVSGMLLFLKRYGRMGVIGLLLVNAVNTVTNFFLCWKLDIAYRKRFFENYFLFWKIVHFYFVVLFSYSSKPNSSKLPLKVSF